jgi:hypothetical protein
MNELVLLTIRDALFIDLCAIFITAIVVVGLTW